MEKETRIQFQKDTARLIARNLVAWDTSKDKREGLLPEVYLSNREISGTSMEILRGK